MSENANAPAYPVVKTEWPNTNFHKTFSEGGLTKREAFAMAAMQGFYSSSNCWPGGDDYREIAGRAVKQADALLEALARIQATT